MTISLIAAHDKNRLIGSNNSLPWNIPNDLDYFRKKTNGSIVVMGRKTFDSIGHPLPNRINIILTHDKNYRNKHCLVFHSVHELLQNICVEEEIFIIGGANLYSQFLPIADILYITQIENEFEGDTYFPEYEHIFTLNKKEKGRKDSKNPYEYYFCEYHK